MSVIFLKMFFLNFQQLSQNQEGIIFNGHIISYFAANTDTIFLQDFLEAKLSDLFRGLGSIPGTNVIKIPP
jgi:hypothetical protein